MDNLLDFIQDIRVVLTIAGLLAIFVGILGKIECTWFSLRLKRFQRLLFTLLGIFLLLLPLISLRQSYSIPSGTIVAFSGTRPPDGWLLCNGQSVDEIKYDKLFGVISTIYGHGNNRGEFKVPDLRGFFLLGKDNMGNQPAGRIEDPNSSMLNGQGGEELHELSIDEIPVHHHDYNDIYCSIEHVDDVYRRNLKRKNISLRGGDSGLLGLKHNGLDNDNCGYEFLRDTEPNGKGKKHNNMPPFVTLNYIIKH